jgi:GntR family transcriptional regulator/MocR family aminotransferase
VADLFVDLRRDAGAPLHAQIEASLRAAIRSGRLPLGSSLPPTRSVAADLGVSRGVVVEAYQQLVAEGYLTSRTGGYTQVAIGPEPPAAAAAPDPAPPLVVDFGYGRADVANFPRAAWLRSVRRVLTGAANERFGYSSGRGVPELREALAAYLNRARGAAADPANMVVTSGYAQAVSLLVQVMAARGVRRIAYEDPSADDDARPMAAAAGIEVAGVPVGPDGIDVGALAASGADAVVLTPSHQWPTGAVLPAASRAAVLRWAAGTGALVVEDDYDAEYRYDRAPIGAMQGLAPDSVAYAGSGSKTLVPGLRLGWLVLPAHLVEDVAAAKIQADRGSSALDQLAFADFLTTGAFERHLRRMRPVYRRRRDALLAALDEYLPGFEPSGVAAGLHLVAWLPDDLDEAAVVEAAAAAGIGVGGVSPYRFTPGRGGLIFGYSTLNERAVTNGVRLLGEVVAKLRAAQISSIRSATESQIRPGR